MTALDKIHNDYIDHKGQEKLRLQPQLVTDIKFLNKNQHDLLQTIQLGPNSYFTQLDGFLDNVTNDIDRALDNSFHVDEDTSDDKQEEAQFSTKANANANAKPLGGSIDGAAFIYTMNVFMQLAYIEKYTFTNLPQEVRVKYLTNLIDIKDLMHAFLNTIQEVLNISTYDPKFTKFDTLNITLGLTKSKINKPLDTPVSK